MNLKKIFVYLIIFIFKYNFAFSSDFKIVAKINNEILTNYDIEIEKKYLIILNPNLKSLSHKELEKLSKNSLIRQSIKKEEIEKHLDFQANSNLGGWRGGEKNSFFRCFAFWRLRETFRAL